MTQSEITQYITATFPGVDVVVASQATGAPEITWGDSFFFCDPGNELSPDHRFPFATIVTRDYSDFDCASNLNREGVFRLNFGVSKETFQTLFGADDSGYDFTALDQIMPHPVYAAQYWICVLNPSKVTFEKLRLFLAEAYELAIKRHPKTRRAEKA